MSICYICDKKMVIINKNELIKQRQDLLREIDSCRDIEQIKILNENLINVDSQILLDTQASVKDIEEKIEKVVCMPEQKTIKEMKKELNVEYAKVREEYAMLQEKLKKNVEQKKIMREEIKTFDDLRKEEPLSEVSKTKMEHIWSRFCEEKPDDGSEAVEEPMCAPEAPLEEAKEVEGTITPEPSEKVGPEPTEEAAPAVEKEE